MSLSRVKKRLGGNRGSILLAAMFMSIMIILVGITYLKFADIQMQAVDLDILRLQAKYASQYAVKVGLTYGMMYSPTDYAVDKTELCKDEKISYSYVIGPAGNGGNGMYTWALHNVAAVGYAQFKNHAYAWTDTIMLGYGTSTMADYLWLTNSEVDTSSLDTVFFWTPDTLDGKVHTNHYLNIMPSSDGPMFYKKVTYCKPDTRPPHASTHAQIQRNFIGNQAAIFFPNEADSIRYYAGTQYTFGDNSPTPDSMWYIRISGNKFRIQAKPFSTNPSVFDANWSHFPEIDLPPLGAIFVKGKLYIDAPRWVTGHPEFVGLHGRVTIGSSDTMYIYHDVLYASSDTSGRVPVDSLDALGLVSEKWILVSKNSGYPVYPNTRKFKINAALAALKGSLAYQGIYGGGTQNEYRSLYIYGCIAQRNRGTIHRGSAGYGSGFIEKDYKYDVRFMNNPPPHWIPTGNFSQQYSENDGNNTY